MMSKIYVLAVVLAVNVRNLRVGSGVGCLMSGIYVLAVVLVVVLADDVRNLRVGGGVGCIVS